MHIKEYLCLVLWKHKKELRIAHCNGKGIQALKLDEPRVNPTLERLNFSKLWFFHL